MFLVSSCSCLCPIHWSQVENKDVVGAAPTGDAPTASEWSTISLPTKVLLILEVWRYIKSAWNTSSWWESGVRTEMEVESVGGWCSSLCLVVYGDLVSWEIYFSRVWSGQPTINRRLKRTCWCDIGLKMVWSLKWAAYNQQTPYAWLLFAHGISLLNM